MVGVDWHGMTIAEDGLVAFSGDGASRTEALAGDDPTASESWGGSWMCGDGAEVAAAVAVEVAAEADSKLVIL